MTVIAWIVLAAGIMQACESDLDPPAASMPSVSTDAGEWVSLADYEPPAVLDAPDDVQVALVDDGESDGPVLEVTAVLPADADGVVLYVDGIERFSEWSPTDRNQPWTLDTRFPLTSTRGHEGAAAHLVAIQRWDEGRVEGRLNHPHLVVVPQAVSPPSREVTIATGE